MATREHIVTDQGNGGAYCSNCGWDVTKHYNECPNCLQELSEGSMYISTGGSDY